jgi:hypothetical protein
MLNESTGQCKLHSHIWHCGLTETIQWQECWEYCHSFEWHEQKDICVDQSSTPWLHDIPSLHGLVKVPGSPWRPVSPHDNLQTVTKPYTIISTLSPASVGSLHELHSEETSRNPTQNGVSSDSRQWWLRALGKEDSTSGVVCKGVWPMHSDLQDLVCL